ncbi:MAG: VWA domain-containing protein, partial [Pirellulales bacterium]
DRNGERFGLGIAGLEIDQPLTGQHGRTLVVRLAQPAGDPAQQREVDIQRPDPRRAIVTYEGHDEVPQSDFRLFYDVGRGKIGTSVISYRPDEKKDGFFLLMASTEFASRSGDLPAKTVLFVVDRSGSMSGKKLKQAKGALRFVLDHLREGDTFNIIAYDSDVESFRPELQKADVTTLAAARGFVEGLHSGGSTNIDGALKAALSQLQATERPSYMIFLTDGLPTIGERKEAVIVDHARQANRVRARLFAFGVGYDVNSRLLDRLARANNGQSEYVRPSEDIEAAVARLYGRIGTPVLTDVAIDYHREGERAEDGPVVGRTVPSRVFDLFAGDQLVLVGRYRQSGPIRVTISGQVDGKRHSFDFAAELVEQSGDQTSQFVERLWAMRRVGQIIDQLDLHGPNKELVGELVRLATRHGIMTPYTSFLADENADLRDESTARREASVQLNALKMTSGRAGVAQRTAKAGLQRALQPTSASTPHYYAVESDQRVDVRTVRTVRSKTFFLKQGRWVDSSVTAEQEQRAITIERFSDAYFGLLDRVGPSAARYLAIEGPVLIELGGEAYAW